MKESGLAEYIFVVELNDKKSCIVQADEAILLEDGAVKFIVNNSYKSTVAVFKEYNHFFTQGENHENI